MIALTFVGAFSTMWKPSLQKILKYMKDCVTIILLLYVKSPEVPGIILTNIYRRVIERGLLITRLSFKN
jgi:hypothetical protein